ncbi:MAG: hypothetical protein A2Y24_01855 [Clostridiales bacterium GWE2_32_10]|nr:MAG: hypothetical protein A2Y24_01855 [Clostridiales bacterium GWE2_32_10]HBY19954.1 hypothetical protein [Clostridiales bacterium]
MGNFVVKSLTMVDVLALCLIVAGMVYLYVNYRFREEIKKGISKISKGIDKITNDKELRISDTNKTLNPVYNALKKLELTINKKNKTKEMVFEMAQTLAVNIELKTLLNEFLNKVMEATGSQWGAFYINNDVTNKLEIKSSIGFSKNIYNEFDIDIGEGIIGQVAQTRRIKIIADIPDDTIYLARTFIGKIKPKNLILVPVITVEKLAGVLVLASIYNYNDDHVMILRGIRNYLGIAINNAIAYERTQRLSKELKFQNDIIQNMNNDLENKVIERTEFLNNVINSIKDYSIISTNKNGIITTWNRGAEVINGYTSDEMIGRNISISYSEKDRETEKVIRDFKMAEKDGEYLEYGWKSKKNGERYFADTIITPIYDNNKKVIGFTNITKDITSIKSMEQALMYEKLFKNKVMDSFDKAIILIDTAGIMQDMNDKLLQITNFDRLDYFGKYVAKLFENEHETEEKLKIIIKDGVKINWNANIILKDYSTKYVSIEAETLRDNEGNVKGIIMFVRE